MTTLLAGPYTFRRDGTVTFVHDSGHIGTHVFWHRRQWVCVTDITGSADDVCVETAACIAAVRLGPGQNYNEDNGLAENSLAWDRDSGVTIVDADWLESVPDDYVEVLFREWPEPRTAYRVYLCPEGEDMPFCGECDTMADAIALAESKPRGLEKSLWGTARAAGHCAGLSAPDSAGDESENASEWRGDYGVFRVTYPVS